MGFFARIFAPPVESLRLQLTEKQRIADWWRENFNSSQQEIAHLKRCLEAETHSNRIREDAFISKILILTSAPGIPTRETLKKEVPPGERDNPENLNDGELILLQSRAEDYCAVQFGADYTPEQFAQTLAAMKNDPAEWLTN